jgi:hypothetical protein
VLLQNLKLFVVSVVIWRPNDLAVSVGSRIEVMLRTARQWTGRIGEPSELYWNRDLQGLQYEVVDVHRTRRYTQVQVHCHQTGRAVWMNVWSRYNPQGIACGVRWAKIVGRPASPMPGTAAVLRGQPRSAPTMA